MTRMQGAFLKRIEDRGGAMQRKDMTAAEVRMAFALVDQGKLMIDGSGIASRGPFNQAAQDTVTFVTNND